MSTTKEKRQIKPDYKYNDTTVTRFINKVMLDGKKTIAESIVYTSLDMLAKETSMSPLEAFKQALDNAAPRMEVKSRRVGGSTYQVPVEVKDQRSMSIAMKWIVHYARIRKGKSMAEKLAQELIDVFNKTGSVTKKREDTHKMAESNKAFAHFRW